MKLGESFNEFTIKCRMNPFNSRSHSFDMNLVGSSNLMMRREAANSRNVSSRVTLMFIFDVDKTEIFLTRRNSSRQERRNSPLLKLHKACT